MAKLLTCVCQCWPTESLYSSVSRVWCLRPLNLARTDPTPTPTHGRNPPVSKLMTNVPPAFTFHDQFTRLGPGSPASPSYLKNENKVTVDPAAFVTGPFVAKGTLSHLSLARVLFPRETRNFGDHLTTRGRGLTFPNRTYTRKVGGAHFDPLPSASEDVTGSVRPGFFFSP